MKLSDLLATLGPERLRAEVLTRDGGAIVNDVVIYDPPHTLGPGQMVLAVGIEASSCVATDLVADAAKAGAAAVVFRASDGPGPADAAREREISLLRVEPHLPWTQLLTLLRTLFSASTADPETSSERLAPSSVHGLADAIAVMVGGSAVLYDRAHKVVAYSVQGFEIDSVRRETILGRQTPEQWIERFTADRSAYETYRAPDSVIRVDGYPGLRTRLRIAICFGDEILGEISVAEGRQKLGSQAEDALRRASRLAVPFMLRHRLVEDTDRATRTRMLRSLLHGDLAPTPQVAAELGLSTAAGFVVVGFAENPSSAESTTEDGEGVVQERILHLLSLQISGVDQAAGVLFCRSTYYALVPVPDARARARLAERIKPSLQQLERIGVTMNAAVGPWVPDLNGLPESRQVVDDLVHVLRRETRPAVPSVVTAEHLWSELALIPVERAIGGTGFVPCAPLRQLLDHDKAQHTDFTSTLSVYLDEFGSVSRTAERLNLHPNTLRHRLQRLGEISGVDLADPVQRLAVEVQLRVLQVEGRLSTGG